MVRAAVLMGQGEPVSVRDIVLDDPGPGRVRVRMHAAGVCHSDLSLANGTLQQPVPAVLGHEGAGVVVSVGTGVDRVQPGDRVLMNWAPSCGECWFCAQGEPYLCEHGEDGGKEPYAALDDGTPLYPSLGTGAFAEETVVSQRGVIRLPDTISLDHVAVLSCAMLTGAGAVLNTAKVRAGQSVVVVGLGGVGLSALQAARAAGADPIIGVDVTDAKAELARTHGATDFVVSGKTIGREVRGLTGGRGADHAFDCVGRPETIRACWSSTRRGGVVSVVGIGGKSSMVEFSALELYWFGRTLHGCVFGSSDPDTDVPRLLDMVAAGQLDLASLATATTTLDGVNEAFDRMQEGTGARTMIRF